MRFLSLVLSLAIVGCAAGPSGDVAPAGDGNVGMSRGSLVDALRQANLAVRDAGAVQQPFFTVPAHVYEVEGRDLQIYEFASAAEAESAAQTVAPDGGSIGTSAMSWMAPPHFFHRDRLIVNYIGTDAKVLKELHRLLGPQFAGRS